MNSFFRIALCLAATLLPCAAELDMDRSVNIGVEKGCGANWDVDRAQTLAAQIFAAIGVKIHWVKYQDTAAGSPGDAILVNLNTRTPPDFYPGALGFSQPFEGIHATVFYDRVRASVEPAHVSSLLGHALAHEIGHLLEGTDHHSSSGVMKARWENRDYAQMFWKPLPFTDFDILLIRRGVDERPARLAARPIHSARRFPR